MSRTSLCSVSGAVERCNKDSEADREGEVYVRNGGVWRKVCERKRRE